MGCDIHAYMERRHDEKSSWWGVASDLEIDRWYELFGYLAGVRNHEVEPIAAPKGIPTDVGWEAKDAFEEWGADAHTPSWLTVTELGNLPDEFKREPFYITGLAYASKYGSDNVRLVFWFDN